MTRPDRYRPEFYADKEDLIDGKPPALVTYLALKGQGGPAYEAVKDAVRRLIADPPYTQDGESTDDPDLIGGPSSRWARRSLYRLGDDSRVPAGLTAFTISIETPGDGMWLTWSRDPDRADVLLIHGLTSAP